MAAARGHTVAFTVTHDDRGEVWVDGGDGPRPLPGGPLHLVTSHPALARRSVLVYGADADGRTRLARLGPAGPHLLLREGARWGGGRVVHVGPLGPTVTALGLGAFRVTVDGLPRVGRVAARPVPLILPPGAEVDGLPVVRADGAVVVRVRRRGTDEVGLAAPRAWRPLVRVPGPLGALGRFPSADDRGRVAVAATLAGVSGAYRVDTPPRPLPLPCPGFVVRSVLVAARGATVLTGTPPGGALEVHRMGRPPCRLLGLGDRIDGAEVVDLALNPASIDPAGNLAVRFALADGREGVGWWGGAVGPDGRA